MLKERQRKWKQKGRPKANRLYCRFPDACIFKEILKARYAKDKGLYHVLCSFQQLCNMQTYIPRYIDLRKANVTVNQMNMDKRKCANYSKCGNFISTFSRTGLCHACSTLRNLKGKP